MRKTSVDVYRQVKAEGLLSKRRWQVYDILYRAGPLTAGETAHHLGVPLNGASPRFSELKARGVIKETDKPRLCSITGRRVLAWETTDELPHLPARKESDKQKIKRLEREIYVLEREIYVLKSSFRDHHQGFLAL